MMNEIKITEEELEILKQTLEYLQTKLKDMSDEEIIHWYESFSELKPFEKEIDGTVYTVNSHFSPLSKESILEKIGRLLGLKIDIV